MVTRVSLSDWLAFLARIRGFENPRLLRDRPYGRSGIVACEIMRGVEIPYGFMRVGEGSAGRHN